MSGGTAKEGILPVPISLRTPAPPSAVWWQTNGPTRLGAPRLPRAFSNSNNGHGPVNSSMTKLDGSIGDGPCVSPLVDPYRRIVQLEQSLIFVQDQHKSMLAYLHLEIEHLQQKNRDLQLCLVLGEQEESSTSRGPLLSLSPEEETNETVSTTNSDVDAQATENESSINKEDESPTNENSLRIEILEKEVQEMKDLLDSSKSNTTTLEKTLDQYRRRVSDMEKKEKNTSDIQDLIGKLQDAERTIGRMRRENADQRRELMCLYSVEDSRNMGGNSGRGRGVHYRRGNNTQPFEQQPCDPFPHVEGMRLPMNHSRGPRRQPPLPAMLPSLHPQQYGGRGWQRGGGNRGRRGGRNSPNPGRGTDRMMMDRGMVDRGGMIDRQQQ